MFQQMMRDGQEKKRQRELQAQGVEDSGQAAVNIYSGEEIIPVAENDSLRQIREKHLQSALATQQSTGDGADETPVVPPAPHVPPAQDPIPSCPATAPEEDKWIKFNIVEEGDDESIADVEVETETSPDHNGDILDMDSIALSDLKPEDEFDVSSSTAEVENKLCSHIVPCVAEVAIDVAETTDLYELD